MLKKKYTLKIALFVAIVTTYCQTFKGIVYEGNTDSTLSFAAVYIGGASIGAIADMNGNFTLDVYGYTNLPITISLLGYYSHTISQHRNTEKHNFYLSPKAVEINEIVVSAKTGKREKYVRIFKREFLGSTKNREPVAS